MDTQMAPVHRHEDPHSVGMHHGEDEHHDRGSVLKKVKAKAKKIKDTLGIKKRAHGHDQDQDRDQFHEEEEEEDDEYEEEPEVHSAPPSPEINPGQSRIDLAHKKLFHEDLDASKGPSSQVFSPSNYQTKEMDPTNASGEEVGITPIIHSFGKMEVFDQPSQGQQKSHIDTGSHDQFFPDLSPSTETKTIPENPQSILENKNVGETTQQSSYTEKISSATSAIADKAISAKNIVATTVTEKLAPVYEKLAGAGSSVVSKVYDTSTSTRSAMDTNMGSDTDTGIEGGGGGGGVEIKRPDTDTSMATGIEGGGGAEKKRPDKGVSMKEYLAEKLKPSDEDKALSKVISEALYKWKDDGEGDKENNKLMGMVTDSPEVAKRLGTDEEVGEGSGSRGKRMVKMIRGAVYSWLGKGTGESHISQESHSPSHGGEEQVRGDEVGQGKVGEGKLLESINQVKDQ